MPPDRDNTNFFERDERALGDALRALPLATPSRSAWPDIAASLAARRRARWRRHAAIGIATAAVLALVVTLALRPADAPASRGIVNANPGDSNPAATVPRDAADNDEAPRATTDSEVESLIAQNQQWERALRRADSRPDTLNGSAALASAEIEDLIGMIDVELGQGSDHDARLLWTQRLQLMADLASLRNGSRAVSAATDGSARLMPANYAID
jgi:hypothetical protein